MNGVKQSLNTEHARQWGCLWLISHPWILAVLIRNLAWMLAQSASYKSKTLLFLKFRQNRFTLQLCSFVLALSASTGDHLYPSYLLTKFLGEQSIWYQGLCFFFSFCYYTKYSKNAFFALFFFFYQIPSSKKKCLRGAIIQLQHLINQHCAQLVECQPIYKALIAPSTKVYPSF